MKKRGRRDPIGHAYVVRELTYVDTYPTYPIVNDSDETLGPLNEGDVVFVIGVDFLPDGRQSHYYTVLTPAGVVAVHESDVHDSSAMQRLET